MSTVYIQYETNCCDGDMTSSVARRIMGHIPVSYTHLTLPTIYSV